MSFREENHEDNENQLAVSLFETMRNAAYHPDMTVLVAIRNVDECVSVDSVLSRLRPNRRADLVLQCNALIART